MSGVQQKYYYKDVPAYRETFDKRTLIAVIKVRVWDCSSSQNTRGSDLAQRTPPIEAVERKDLASGTVHTLQIITILENGNGRTSVGQVITEQK